MVKSRKLKILHGLDRSDSNQYFYAGENEKWRNAAIYLVDLGIEQSLFFSLSDK